METFGDKDSQIGRTLDELPFVRSEIGDLRVTSHQKLAVLALDCESGSNIVSRYDYAQHWDSIGCSQMGSANYEHKSIWISFSSTCQSQSIASLGESHSPIQVP